MTKEKILLKHFGCRDRNELFEKYQINFTTLDIIISAMESYHEQKLNKLPVMRPASASAVGGELLPAEGSAKGVSVCKDNTRHKDGPCKYKIGSCDDCQTP